jgi:DNA-directed RNA polymerase specialized sigma subunit
LLKASKNYDGNRGASLWTYAIRFVQGAMLRFLEAESSEASHPEDYLEPYVDAFGLGVAGPSKSWRETVPLDFDAAVTHPRQDHQAEVAQLVSIASGEMICLSEQERRVVRLSLVEGLCFTEIARSLELSSNDKAERIYHGAIGKLRERVGARV